VNTDTGQNAAPSLTELPPVVEHVFVSTRDGFELIGAYCDHCHKYFFPIREHCSNCLGDTNETTLGSRGEIYSFTVIRTKPPFGLPQPYGVAYIDLVDFPLRVFSLLDPQQLEDVDIGAQVQLCVGPMGVNNTNQACQRPFFRLSPTSNEY